MSNLTYLADMTDRAIHFSKFDNRLAAETRRHRIIFIQYLESAIRRRLADGRSMDCDEYQALRKFADRNSHEVIGND